MMKTRKISDMKYVVAIMNVLMWYRDQKRNFIEALKHRILKVDPQNWKPSKEYEEISSSIK